MKKIFRVGVVSDTHGLLRPRVVDILRGCDHILHAGDIGGPDILEDLRAIGPCTAVRGNVDWWADTLPETELVELASRFIYVLHDLTTLDLVPRAAGIDVVVSGHSHRPKICRKGDVLFFNPGSAGPRRFRLPVTMGMLEISPDAEILRPRLIHLAD